MPEETSRVALLPYGEVVEDWLDRMGLTFAHLRDELAGGWMFSYVDALRSQGVGTVLVCFSRTVSSPSRFRHGPTGAVLWALPPGRSLVTARRRMLREPIGPSPNPRRVARAALRHLVPYLSTPLVGVGRIIHRERCGAIIVQDYEYARFDAALAIGTALGIPTFGSFQGGVFQESRLEAPVRRLTMRRCAGLIIPAASEIERVVSTYAVDPRKIAHIPNPLDLDFWSATGRSEARRGLGIPDDALMVISHGRTDIADKGLDTLLDAWQVVERRSGDGRLLLYLVGRGTDAGLLPRLIEDRGLRGVRYLDRFLTDRAAVRRLLSAADVYAFAGRFEGFSLAMVEAMACGLPVATSSTTGVADILGAQPGGLVVAKDDVQGLAAALLRLVADRELREGLGAIARARVEGLCGLPAVGEQLRGFLVSRGARLEPAHADQHAL